MIRAIAGLLLGLCCTSAWGQSIYPAYPQPPAPSAYPQYGPFNQPQFYGGGAPYGFGGYGIGAYGPGGYGFGGYGFGGYGFGRYGFGAVGPYPLVGLGNLNWLPPNRPSPYFVAPSGGEYLEQVRRSDQATYSEIMLRHSAQQ